MKATQTFAVNVSALPDWADLTVLPHGTFKEFTTNTPLDVQPPQYDRGQGFGILANWNGAAFVPEFGTMGAICYTGGGEHIVGSADCTLGSLVLDIGARQYKWRNASSVLHTQCINMTGDPTDDFGYYLSDGTTQSTHVYANVCRVPTSWGITGQQGGMARVSCNNGSSFTLADIESWASTSVYDLAQEIHGHSRLNGNQTYSFPPFDPSYSQGGAACIDLGREGWWSCSGGSGYLNFTHKSGTITRYGPVGGAGWGVGNSSTYIQYDQTRDTILFFCGGFNDSFSNLFMLKNPVINTETTYREIEEFPVPPGPGTTAPQSIGPNWSTLLDCYVGLHDGAINSFKILKLHPKTSDFYGAWICETETLTNAPGDTSPPHDVANHASMNGSWGKFVECVPLRAFAWTRMFDQKGQLLRPKGM